MICRVVDLASIIIRSNLKRTNVFYTKGNGEHDHRSNGRTICVNRSAELTVRVIRIFFPTLK